MVQENDNKTSAVEVVREINDMVDGWQLPLTPDQDQRLREAADWLYTVASQIDRENWERYGHA